jgi:hypothetical protein
MDEVSYAPATDGNRWRLVKRLELAPDTSMGLPRGGAATPGSFARHAAAEAKA